ncbi:hypothetical protein OB2597_06730 [Pseudooceanicola batsensis HTCC2597]|uniref:Uncharacterized protein n=1 Tax=Pseudooceanicola batsensis (strain ATCC BAA-863 / DSM 15984 / KCTC 12145 / HTCC2597) TaxID=252305 RepID=A3TTI1_PSEBH|nr:hypothetical protein [Pseudooceanicola batsensis]EAQ04958.1 hypothetical protein OB2597_06730 [Pseudooceanicola batsensis HTCC2597]
MQDFDDSSGRKLAARDNALTRNHLEDWARHGNIPDSAFRFVDRFVRKISITPEYEEVFEEAKAIHDQQSALSFSDVYQRRRIKEGMMEYLLEVSGRFLYTQPLGDSFYKHIIMRIDFAVGGVIKVTLAYCKANIFTRTLQPDHNDLLFYEGYIFPVPEDSGDAEPIWKGMNSDSWMCRVKLFRPQMKGSLVNGCADGKMEYGFLSAMTEHAFVNINILQPTSILSPATTLDSADQRFHETDQHGLQKSAPKLALLNEQKYSENFEEIFQQCYKGYLF